MIPLLSRLFARRASLPTASMVLQSIAREVARGDDVDTKRIFDALAASGATYDDFERLVGRYAAPPLRNPNDFPFA